MYNRIHIRRGIVVNICIHFVDERDDLFLRYLFVSISVINGSQVTRQRIHACVCRRNKKTTTVRAQIAVLTTRSLIKLVN